MQSPQFQQAVSMFSMALQSGQIAPLVSHPFRSYTVNTVTIDRFWFFNSGSWVWAWGWGCGCSNSRRHGELLWSVSLILCSTSGCIRKSSPEGKICRWRRWKRCPWGHGPWLTPSHTNSCQQITTWYVWLVLYSQLVLSCQWNRPRFTSAGEFFWSEHSISDKNELFSWLLDDHVRQITDGANIRHGRRGGDWKRR